MFSQKAGSADTGGFTMRNIMSGGETGLRICWRSMNPECYYCSRGMNLTAVQMVVKG